MRIIATVPLQSKDAMNKIVETEEEEEEEGKEEFSNTFILKT
jgi:hypothetical protein